MVRVCVAGATGKVGKGLVAAIGAAEDLRLTGAVARRSAGQTLGDVTIRETVAAALEADAPDVFVDYTRADAVKGHVLAAVDRGVHVVVGSSGLSDGDFAEIDAAARRKEVGVFAAGNFAVTAVLLQRFALMAAKYVGSWEILEYAYPAKVDAPSGTARELASRLASVAPPSETGAEGTVGMREARGATLGGGQVHSIRLGGFTSSAEVIFGLPGERLTIRHDAVDPTLPYVGGTLLAIRRVSSLRGVVRGLDRIMEE